MPKLVVLDLDMCVWSPEMYTLSQVPNLEDTGHVHGPLLAASGSGEVSGCVGCKSGSDVIRLFPGALHALQQFWRGELGDEVRFAAASSADTPLAVKIGRRAMEVLEVVPGVTMRQVFARGWPEGFEENLQIGRTPPLSSDKSKTHFPLLHKHTGIAYEEMLFFDDSNWGDHVGQMQEVHGVIGVRTPDGMQVHEWEHGLEKFARERHGKK